MAEQSRMKILSFHPFSIYANGGGSRILRRLYQGREERVISLAIEYSNVDPPKGDIQEVVVKASPVIRKWMRWYLRTWAMTLREKTFRQLTNRRARQAASKLQFDVIHIVHHGPFAEALCTDQFSDKPLWVSFHDHYRSTVSSYDAAKLLWSKADRRLVISDELGREYQNSFGNKPYELITDGVYREEISPPAARQEQPLEIYFAGLLHLAYLPLFETLANALDILSKKGLSFKLILRATQQLPFLANRLFEVEYRNMTLDNAELKAELDSAALLYLPIKFTDVDFYLYSLSTKMVGYLGAPGSILYHGPMDSAACKLLLEWRAAACCGTLNVNDLISSISDAITNQKTYSIQAKRFVQDKFDMATIQNKFWQMPAEHKLS